MVSPDTSAGSEEEASLEVPVPEGATKLHLQFDTVSREGEVKATVGPDVDNEEKIKEGLRYEIDAWDNLEEVRKALSSIKKRLGRQRMSLRRLKEKAAKYGTEDAPGSLIIDIWDTQVEIDELKEQRDFLQKHGDLLEARPAHWHPWTPSTR